MDKSDLFAIDGDGVLISFFDEAINEKGVLEIPEGIKLITRPLSSLIIPSDSSKKIKVLILPKSLTFFSNALYQNSDTKLVVFNSVVTFDFGFPVFIESVVEEVILPEGYSVYMSFGCPFLEPFEECDTIRQVTTYALDKPKSIEKHPATKKSTKSKKNIIEIREWDLFIDNGEYFINTLTGEMHKKTPEELRITRVHLPSLEKVQEHIEERIENIINGRQMLPIPPLKQE